MFGSARLNFPLSAVRGRLNVGACLVRKKYADGKVTGGVRTINFCDATGSNQTMKHQTNGAGWKRCESNLVHTVFRFWQCNPRPIPWILPPGFVFCRIPEISPRGCRTGNPVGNPTESRVFCVMGLSAIRTCLSFTTFVPSRRLFHLPPGPAKK